MDVLFDSNYTTPIDRHFASVAAILDMRHVDLPETFSRVHHLIHSRVVAHAARSAAQIVTLSEHAKFLAVNAQTNSANMGFNLISRYPRADFVCADALEARLASKDRTGELTQIINQYLPAAIDCNRFMITNGRHGSLTYERGDVVRSISSRPGRSWRSTPRFI